MRRQRLGSSTSAATHWWSSQAVTRKVLQRFLELRSELASFLMDNNPELATFVSDNAWSAKLACPLAGVFSQLNAINPSLQGKGSSVLKATSMVDPRIGWIQNSMKGAEPTAVVWGQGIRNEYTLLLMIALVPFATKLTSAKHCFQWWNLNLDHVSMWQMTFEYSCQKPLHRQTFSADRRKPTYLNSFW